MIIEAAMVSNFEGITDKIPMDVGTFGTIKKSSLWKPLSNLLTILNTKQKTAVQILGDAKNKHKAIIIGSFKILVLISGGGIQK